MGSSSPSSDRTGDGMRGSVSLGSSWSTVTVISPFRLSLPKSDKRLEEKNIDGVVSPPIKLVSPFSVSTSRPARRTLRIEKNQTEIKWVSRRRNCGGLDVQLELGIIGECTEASEYYDQVRIWARNMRHRLLILGDLSIHVRYIYSNTLNSDFSPTPNTACKPIEVIVCLDNGLKPPHTRG